MLNTENENSYIETLQEDGSYTDSFQKHVNGFFNRPVTSYKKRQAAIKIAKGNQNNGNSRFRDTEIERWLQNPANSERQLRELSNYLYRVNSLYRWFVSILTNMPTWAWTLSMDTFGNKKDKDKLEKLYRQGTEYGDKKFNLHELNKIFKYVVKEDWFYGYEIESDDSYFILKLDPNYCRVSSIIDNGIKSFQFNFTYFDDKKDITDETKNIVNSYPDEFIKGYAKYKRTGKEWIQLDPLNTVCWKLQDDLEYGLPYFIQLFFSLSDIGFFKDIEKAKAEIDSFLLIHQQIPMLDNKKLNNFAIDLKLAADFDGLANDILPENISMFTSPMKITGIKTERSNNDKDNIKNATTQTYTGAGLPEELGNATSAAGLAKAIMANEQIAYNFYRQIEQTMNFKIKYKFTNAKFRFRILDFTHFSRDEKVKELLSGAQNGLVPPSHVASAQGINPYNFLNDVDLETNVLDITSKLKPLQTSYTMSGKDGEGSGRPQKEDGELSDSGIATRNNDSNNKKG